MDQVVDNKLIIDLTDTDTYAKVYGGTRKIALFGKTAHDRAMNLICSLPGSVREELYSIFRTEHTIKEIYESTDCMEELAKIDEEEAGDIVIRAAERYVAERAEFSEDFEKTIRETIISMIKDRCCT